MEGHLELNICLPSNREDVIIFDLGAREVEDRRIYNPSWPFRCSVEAMTE